MHVLGGVMAPRGCVCRGGPRLADGRLRWDEASAQAPLQALGSVRFGRWHIRFYFGGIQIKTGTTIILIVLETETQEG